MKVINNVIKEDRVSYEVAKLLKDKGFDVSSKIGYNSKKELVNIDTSDWYSANCALFAAPTQALVVKWVRINYDINIEATYLPNIGAYRWLSKPRSIKGKDFKSAKDYDKAVYKYYGKDNYNTPEAAIEAALEYTLTKLI